MTKVEIIDVMKRFGNVTALNGVSLEISSSELFSILGPSGCGKTTLLRIVSGLESPDSGRIFFDGEDVTDLDPRRRGAVMVFQNYALWPHMTVFENIAYGLKVRKLPKEEIKERVMWALELVKLEGLGGRYPSQLSGGQQQRVALARALVVEPRILLLDEPLSNLDAKLRVEMRAEIRRIQRELGTTLIYVTHDQEEAMSISDRIAVMSSGKVEQIGEPREIYERPKTIFVAEFVGKCNIIRGRAISENRLILLGRELKLNTEGFEGEVVVAIRPEKIKINQDGRFSGKVTLIETHTFYRDIYLDCNGEEVLIREFSDFKPLKEGEMVRFDIREEHLNLIGPGD